MRIQKVFLILTAAFCFLLAPPSRVSFSEEPEKPKALNFTIEGSGSGVYFDRSENFRIANTGNWGNTVLLGLGGNETPLVYDTDGWGGGYAVQAVASGEKPLSFEARYAQSFFAKRMSKSVPGVGAGLLTTMAFLDGRAHGRPETFGFFVSSSPTPNVNAIGEATLKHHLDTESVSLLGRYHLLRNRRLLFDLFAGPAYTRLAQDYKFLTRGTNASNGRAATSLTQEELADHLMGGHLGVDGKIFLWKRFYLAFRQLFGFFVRYSRFFGEQKLENVSGNAGGGAIVTSLTDTIRVRDSQMGFSPEFQTEVSLGCQVTSWFSLSFFYQSDTWLNLARVENAVVRVDLRTLLTGSTSIQEETFRSHLIGGRVSLRF